MSRIVALSLVAASLTACGSGGNPIAPPPPTVLGTPASVTITRSGSYILVGDTLQLSVVVKDAAGHTLSGTSPNWSVNLPAVGALSGSTLTAVSPGVVQVTASIGTINSSAQISVSPGGGTRAPSLSSIDSAVLSEMKRLGIPGGSLSITKDGRLVLSRAYGYADSATRRQAAPDQLWRIGGLSKPITAVAIMKLVEGGSISLDDKPFVVLTGIDLLPGQTQDPRLTSITVRDLLQHSGGWNVSRNVDDTVFAALAASGNPDPKWLVRSARGVALATNPGTQFAYVNYGYLVLGRIIERATGGSYESYVRNAILAPAGITAMKLGFTSRSTRDPLEVSYYDHRPPITSILGTGLWPDVGGGMEYSEAAGEWLGSSLDLVKFLGEVDGNTTRPDLLTVLTMSQMTARNATLWPTAGDFFGFGWEVMAKNAGLELSQIGSQDGGDSYMVKRPDGVSAAILFNLTRNLVDPAMTANAAIDAALNAITIWPTGVVF